MKEQVISHVAISIGIIPAIGVFLIKGNTLLLTSAGIRKLLFVTLLLQNLPGNENIKN